jgi:hypothetical protein
VIKRCSSYNLVKFSFGRVFDEQLARSRAFLHFRHFPRPESSTSPDRAAAEPSRPSYRVALDASDQRSPASAAHARVNLLRRPHARARPTRPSRPQNPRRPARAAGEPHRRPSSRAFACGAESNDQRGFRTSKQIGTFQLECPDNLNLNAQWILPTAHASSRMRQRLPVPRPETLSHLMPQAHSPRAWGFCVGGPSLRL